MKKDPTVISQKIKQYSDAINTMILHDINLMLDQQFDALTQRQMTVLDLLSERSRTVNEIAEHFSITASAASQLIKKMEQEDYVKREINLHNRREIIVRLDQKGIKFIEKVSEIEMLIIEKYYMQLHEEELDSLLRIMKQLHQITIKVHQQQDN